MGVETPQETMEGYTIFTVRIFISSVSVISLIVVNEPFLTHTIRPSFPTFSGLSMIS